MLYENSTENTLTNNELETDLFSSSEWCPNSEVGEIVMEPSTARLENNTIPGNRNDRPSHKSVRDFRKNRDRWKVDYKTTDRFVHPDIEFETKESTAASNPDPSLSALTFQNLFAMGDHSLDMRPHIYDKKMNQFLGQHMK